MPRAKRTAKPRPAPVQDIRRFDEFNVARLGLISIHERIPDDFTTWTQEFEREGHVARLQCVAPAEYGGVPHGLDGDIATAIITLFTDAGAPSSGEIRTTAYRLLQRAGLPDTGYYYHSLKQSLFRLRFAGYTASEGWRDHARGAWTTATFNYLDALEFESDDKQLNLSTGSELLIRLAKPIVRSIRARYVKPLDYSFLTSLDRPLTRALYRLLDAKRYPPEDPTTPMGTFTVNLVAWAQECKIRDNTPDKIRRTLAGAHDELLERGYLQAVRYEGRGQRQTLTYDFADPVPTVPDGDLPETPALKRLLAYRVSRPVAQNLVQTFGEAHVLSRVDKFEHLLRSGYQARVKSALLVDVVRDPGDKYPAPEGYAPPEVREKARSRAGQAEQEDRERVEREAREDLEKLSRPQQVEATLRGLKVLLDKRLSADEQTRLRHLLLAGRLDPLELGRRVTRAAFEVRLEEVIDDLRRSLRAAEPGAATIDVD